MRGVWGLLLASVVGCAPIMEERSFTIEGEFDAVQLKLSNGEAQLGLASGDAVEMDVDFGGVGRPQAVSRRVEDGVLIIDYSCALCGGDLVVGIPDGMPLDVSVLHGDLELNDLTGPVRGDVHTGSIEGSGLACDTDLIAHAGEIDLGWDFRPTAVQAEAHIGALRLEVPAGAYDLDVRARLGLVRFVNVQHDADADSAITAFAHAGEAVIDGS